TPRRRTRRSPRGRRAGSSRLRQQDEARTFRAYPPAVLAQRDREGLPRHEERLAHVVLREHLLPIRAELDRVAVVAQDGRIEREQPAVDEVLALGHAVHEEATPVV